MIRVCGRGVFEWVVGVGDLTELDQLVIDQYNMGVRASE